LIASTGGGCLTRPNDSAALADALAEVLADAATRRRYAESGRRAVHQQRNADVMAQATRDVFQQYVPRET
jgi:glycosyltransferase involved in cell wall biosynthesis